MQPAPPPSIRNVLSIAGSDPSGGAGIQADLKTFAANGVYGMAVVTALTAQNTQCVTGVELVSPDFISRQIDTVFADVRVDAVKIGMIATAEIARAIADALRRHEAPNVVLDPVMVAKGGDRLLTGEAVAALRSELIPLADMITPNLPEAAVLLDAAEAASRDEMDGAATRLMALGCRSVLLKGGHLAGDESPDLLVTAARRQWFEGRRMVTRNTHGTGCTLSSALAAQLALTGNAFDAARSAKAYVAGAIAAADRLDVGSGHGPTHHFHIHW
ncbi:bifunctional hydroxymethylpyrimidine kinase/phosphomethylpyrimidine kinase [Aurantimonas sp. A2-1-M11]|uniref:bifunctional hydroxymethylpyrimidine kinase/phosphomethylpyrimidine kinase n=1 Tax=Aurantimonas sp. A2-1-M11 TaxID=3113712 RepID=UPI002F922321